MFNNGITKNIVKDQSPGRTKIDLMYKLNVHRHSASSHLIKTRSKHCLTEFPLDTIIETSPKRQELILQSQSCKKCDL